LLPKRGRRLVGFIEPCLPSPAKVPPSGLGWIHEIKHDGFRIMARRDAAGVRLITRKGNDLMSEFDVVESFRRNALPFRRQVSISRDDEDFVVAFQPDNIIALRNSEANALRKMCHTLRWEIVSDTTPEPDDPASW
jgi:hypothetical protein